MSSTAARPPKPSPIPPPSVEPAAAPERPVRRRLNVGPVVAPPPFDESSGSALHRASVASHHDGQAVDPSAGGSTDERVAATSSGFVQTPDPLNSAQAQGTPAWPSIEEQHGLGAQEELETRFRAHAALQPVPSSDEDAAHMPDQTAARLGEAPSNQRVDPRKGWMTGVDDASVADHPSGRVTPSPSISQDVEIADEVVGPDGHDDGWQPTIIVDYESGDLQPPPAPVPRRKLPSFRRPRMRLLHLVGKGVDTPPDVVDVGEADTAMLHRFDSPRTRGLVEDPEASGETSARSGRLARNEPVHRRQPEPVDSHDAEELPPSGVAPSGEETAAQPQAYLPAQFKSPSAVKTATATPQHGSASQKSDALIVSTQWVADGDNNMSIDLPVEGLLIVPRGTTAIGPLYVVNAIIRGEVIGTVTASENVIIEPGAKVSGLRCAIRAIVCGEVGRQEPARSVVLQAGEIIFGRCAQVFGHVVTQRMIVYHGASINGRVHTLAARTKGQ